MTRVLTTPIALSFSLALVLAIGCGSAMGMSVAGYTNPLPETLGIHGDAGDNEIDAQDVDHSLVIRDEAGITARSGCEKVSPTEVICELKHWKQRIRVRLGSGDDNVTFEQPFLTFPFIAGGRGSDQIRIFSDDRLFNTNQVEGNRGNDLIFGGEGRDTLKGGPGTDRILGGSGRDNLVGGLGPDYLRGQDGADRLGAHDGHRDHVIDCGVRPDGSRRLETAAIDRLEHSRVLGCGRIVIPHTQ